MNCKRILPSLLLCILSLLWVLPSYGQSIAQLDADNGFMGIPLAKADTLVRYLIPSGKSQQLRKSRLPQDKLTYQGIPLVSVTVFSFRGEIHSIDIKTTGGSTEMMLKKLKERYGEGSTGQVRSFQVEWKGDRVYLCYERSYMSDEGKFSFTSLEVHKAYLKHMEDLKYGK